MEQSGAKIIVDCLIEQGVEYVFGYPGGYIIDVFDELYKQSDKITQVLTCHEQGASHAADGYARASGKVGVCMSTSGPGATNLVTGIATAYMDSSPIIAITGNVPINYLGRDSFQEVDIAGVTMPVTKHNYIVKDIKELADTIREAFKIATSGRPGPVLIDVPKNIQQQLFEYTPYTPVKKDLPFFKEQEGLSAAVEIINSAKRPLIYLGGGAIISNASREIAEFASLINCPVSSSMMGLGAFPASDEKFLGMIGMHGHAAVSKALLKCDTLIAIGARFSDRVAGDREKFAANAKIVHIDIDTAEIDKNVMTKAHIMGDVKKTLKYLLPLIEKKENREWLNETIEFVKSNPLHDSTKALCPRKIIRVINELTPDNQIIATDVGQHQMWTAQSYKFSLPRTLITSGGLGTMGFGLGAAIGASMGTKRRVCLITGDGSFHMNFNEIVTAVKQKLPITIFLFNNNSLGMVKQWQTLFYGKRYSSTTLNMPTDYMMLAKALGATGFILEKNEDIDSVIKKALAIDTPCLVDCRIGANEYVLPMIPAGKGSQDIITELEEY